MPGACPALCCHTACAVILQLAPCCPAVARHIPTLEAFLERGVRPSPEALALAEHSVPLMRWVLLLEGHWVAAVCCVIGAQGSSTCNSALTSATCLGCTACQCVYPACSTTLAASPAVPARNPAFYFRSFPAVLWWSAPY